MNCKNCEGYDTAFGCGIFKCNNILSKRLDAYEEAEKQGLLIRLPRKLGDDTVYAIIPTPLLDSKMIIVPIVRCGECRHWKRIRNDCILASCELDAVVRSEDFFCADGRRKDDDKNI